MSTFPNVLLFRYDKYSHIDAVVKQEKEECTFHIVSHKDFLSLLYDTKYPILVTFGDKESEYWEDVHSMICDRMRSRWIHYSEIKDIHEVYRGIQYCFIHTVLKDREATRPIFSAFTTCYNSYDKIKRPYETLKKQSFKDWEWVILDDSPEDTHFQYLRALTKGDSRIRLYRRSENSGNIGNVKNEAASLCRGKYVLELDHDDEIVPEFVSEESTFSLRTPQPPEAEVLPISPAFERSESVPPPTTCTPAFPAVVIVAPAAFETVPAVPPIQTAESAVPSILPPA